MARRRKSGTLLLALDLKHVREIDTGCPEGKGAY
jgi:hypothetical protein